MRRGPLYMVGATFAFTVMIGAVKVAREELSAFDVMLWRGVVSLPLSLWLARKVGLTIHNRGAMLRRALLGFLAMTCFFTATQGLDISDLTILGKLQPILIAIFAPLVLGASERSGKAVWVVLAAGLLGSLLIVGPGLDVGNVHGLWALAAAVFSAGAHVTVRQLTRTDEPLAVVFWFQVVVVVLSLLVLFAFSDGPPTVPPARLHGPVALVGLTATIGQVWMTRAYAADRASTVAAASYTAPLFGVLADLLVFGTTPSTNALLGGVLVVGAGLYLVLRREGELSSGSTRAPDTR